MEMRFIKTVFLIGVLLGVCGIFADVCADCIYAGQSYPTGTIINGYVCEPDGTWGH